MSEPVVPIEPNSATELETLRKTITELTQKAATRKARITELESNASALQAKATEAETRIKALTIDAPLDHLCESISVAPQALRTALEADFKVELDKNGILTLLNRTDNKPVVDKNGKLLPLESEAVRNLLLATKDEAKLKLYRAIVVINRASGAAHSSSSTRTTSTSQKQQFGLGMSLK